MLKIRLRRMGAKHRPFFRVVVSDSRRAPSARVVDTIGHYDPMKSPKQVRLDVEKAEAWIARGAEPSATVAGMIKQQKKVVDAATV